MGQTHAGPAPFDYLDLPVCSGSTDSGAGSGSGAAGGAGAECGDAGQIDAAQHREHQPGAQRQPAETFVNTVKRVGIEPFKTAANAVRVATARTPVAA